MMTSAQQAARAAAQVAQQQRQAAQLARQQAAADARTAALNAKAAQQLALRSTPVKRESNGLNLDALGTPEQIDALAQGYDQVQFKNANESVLFQRAVSGQTVKPAADVNAGGVLQVVPDAGPKFAAYQAEQKAAQPATQSSPNLLVLIGGGAVLLIGSILLLRR